MRDPKIGALIAIPIVAAMLSLFTTAPAQSRSSTFAPLQAKIDALVATQNIPSVSIGVSQNGEIVWEESFGWADRERRKRATPQTLYSIGSTSKPITAAAIMLLVDQGKIDLDAPVNNYLDEKIALRSPFNDLNAVTVRKLLNHTSGLSRHSQFFIGPEIASAPPLETTIQRYGRLAKPAGESFEYTNLGYGILSYLVNRVARQSFGDFLRQRIFLPLGMRGTFYGARKGHESSVALPYSPEQDPTPNVISDTPGAADVQSSVHDLLLFGLAQMGEFRLGAKPILTDASRKLMTADSSVRGISTYGLGWEMLQVGKYRLVYHHGSNGYGTSIFVLLPEKRICISILSNITTPAVETLADDILKLLVPDYETDLTQFKASLPREQAQPYQPSESYLGHWSGTVATWKEQIPVEMWFQSDGDVQIQMKGQYRNLLNGVRMEGPYLRGSFRGDIGTEDANRHPYNLHLRLRLREGGAIDGSITSSSTNPSGNVLSNVIHLEKQR